LKSNFIIRTAVEQLFKVFIFSMILIGNKIVLVYYLIATFFDIKYAKKSSIDILVFKRVLGVFY